MTIVRTIQRRATPDYKTYVGSGKLDEIIRTAKELGGEILILNNQIKPRQMFAIQEKLRPHNLRAWDRIDLILNIFQKHATTREAKLQIELASIRHMGPRIFDMGVELGQQGAGIGTRGIGETNTEIMKRHLKEKERKIKKHLQHASRGRKLHRDARKRQGFLTVSIVGYTNAGKSSLLNALTQKDALVANALFATLDTRVAARWLPQMNSAILLSDTIGFIRNLPPQLIDAFRSTLEETINADLLLHVMDASDPSIHMKRDVVLRILEDLGVSHTPRIDVFNKIDLGVRNECADYPDAVHVSATENQGLKKLCDRIALTVS